MKRTSAGIGMQTNRKATLGAVGAFLVAAIALVPSAANAEGLPPISLSDDQIAAITQRLADHGASADQQSSLMDKLEGGDVWDSMSGADPLSVTTTESDGFDVTLSLYADGSYTESMIEIPTSDGIGARSIGGCSSSGTSAGVTYATNCTVEVSNALTGGRFIASYSRWASGSSISNYNSGQILFDVGVATAGGFTTSSNWVRWNWTTEIPGWYSADRWVELYVSPSSVFTSASF